MDKRSSDVTLKVCDQESAAGFEQCRTTTITKN